MTYIHVIGLPRFEGNRMTGTLIMNPYTGKYTLRGLGATIVMLGDKDNDIPNTTVFQITPTVRDLKRIRDDIDKYLKEFDKKSELQKKVENLRRPIEIE